MVGGDNKGENAAAASGAENQITIFTKSRILSKDFVDRATYPGHKFLEFQRYHSLTY
jgi:hypothetical protein